MNGLDVIKIKELNLEDNTSGVFFAFQISGAERNLVINGGLMEIK